MAAPASAAPMAASAIYSAVTGRCGDIDGVWTEPVTAEEMITFRALIRTFLRFPHARASESFAQLLQAFGKLFVGGGRARRIEHVKYSR